jgi:hypothetical protein
MIMQVRGAPAQAVANLDEWIVFDILSIIDTPSQRHAIERAIDIQIICYSKHGIHRSDNKLDAVYRLADKYAAAFQSKDIMIKSTCISFKENRMVPLDLRSTGDFAKSQVNALPPLHTMSMVILNQGTINSYIEG